METTNDTFMKLYPNVYRHDISLTVIFDLDMSNDRKCENIICFVEPSNTSLVNDKIKS